MCFYVFCWGSLAFPKRGRSISRSMFVFSSYFICLGSLALPKRGRSSFRPRFLLFVIFFCYLFGVARVAQKGLLEFPLEFFVFFISFSFICWGSLALTKRGRSSFRWIFRSIFPGLLVFFGVLFLCSSYICSLFLFSVFFLCFRFYVILLVVLWFFSFPFMFLFAFSFSPENSGPSEEPRGSKSI